MKKIVFTLSLLMCWTVASAQIDFSQLRLGARAGFGVGMVDAKYQDETQSDSGGQLFIGAAAELPVWKFIRLNGEIYFEHTWASNKIDKMYMTGTGAAGATVFIHTKTTYPLNYIHIPIMARACFVKDFVYVEAGPQFGFLVGNVKTHTEGTETTKPNTPLAPSQVVKVNKDDDAHFKKTYAGWVLGWGGNFGHNREFSAGIRVGIGINDLQHPDHKLDGVRVTHSDVQISMRYWF